LSTFGSTIWRILEVVYETTSGNESTSGTTSTRKKVENENDKTENLCCTQTSVCFELYLSNTNKK
jgi:hypothetical protein